MDVYLPLDVAVQGIDFVVSEEPEAGLSRDGVGVNGLGNTNAASLARAVAGAALPGS